MFEDIIAHLDVEYFYLQFLSDKSRIGAELLTNCPFHDDSKASLSVNLTTGLWRCHTVDCPQHKGGNAIQFYAAIKKIPLEKAVSEIRDKFITTPEQRKDKVDKQQALLEQVQNCHLRLLRNPEALQYLTKECGYDNTVIDKYSLGYDGKRYWIPIVEDGVLLNIRQYSPTDAAKMKGLSGCNEMRIWPYENLHGETIYIFEGEKDCLLANRLGLNAITVTAGAGSFKPEWVVGFKGKHVVVCYDIDDAGAKGAQIIAEYLAGVVNTLKVVKLPLEEPSNADFTDYIVNAQYTVKDFEKLAAETPNFEGKGTQKVIVDDKVYEVELADASSKEYFFKRCRMQVIVVGKDLAPYLVPKKLKVHCLMGKKVCPYCGIGLKGGDFEIEFNEESPDILRLINCTDMQQERAIREKLDVYGACRQYNYEIIEAQNIEEIKLTPEIKYSTSIKEYVIRTGYYLGHGLKANQSYVLKGITVPHPQTQYATHIVYDTKESDLSVDQFHLTPEIIKELAVFQICP